MFCGLGLSAAFLGGVFGTGGGGGDSFWTSLALAAVSSGVCIVMGLQLLQLVDLPLPSFELDLNLDDNSNSNSNSNSNNNNNGEIECIACSQIAFNDEGGIVQPNDSSSIPASISTSMSMSTSTNTNTNTNTNIVIESNTDSILRTFLLGGSSALVASPCATPVLTSILAFVASVQDPVLGALLLFVYTIGYSTPLLVVGATGGQALVNLQNQDQNQNGSDNDNDNGAAWMNLDLNAVGQFVNPLTATVLISYGVNGFLVALFGDPSLAGLAPILE